MSLKRRGFVCLLFVGLGGLVLLQGCLLPNPVDMRMNLTVAVTEILPTPTGFAQTISGGTPRPSGVGAGAAATILPSELTGDSPFYAVVLVSPDNLLNVRTGPGIDQPILETLSPTARDLKLTGQEQVVDGELWYEIRRPEGAAGWVNSIFLTQQVPAEAFCTTPKVKTLMRDFARAIQENDREALARMINPQRGLTVRKEWWNNEVYYPPDAVQSLLADETAQSWGVDPVSGEAVEGNFRQVLWPLLKDVVDGDFNQACNTLDFGVATGVTSAAQVWPAEYSNVNYMILYRPGADGDELGWRTWGVGIEILTGEPYITFLVQYHWES